MKKGDVVKCISCQYGEFTVGQTYQVKAGYGDKDTVCHGLVGENAFIVSSDRDGDCYCLFPSCAYAEWELV